MEETKYVWTGIDCVVEENHWRKSVGGIYYTQSLEKECFSSRDEMGAHWCMFQNGKMRDTHRMTIGRCVKTR